MDQDFVGVLLLVQRFLRLSHVSLTSAAQDGSSFLDTAQGMVNWQIFPFPGVPYSGSEVAAWTGCPKPLADSSRNLRDTKNYNN